LLLVDVFEIFLFALVLAIGFTIANATDHAIAIAIIARWFPPLSPVAGMLFFFSCHWFAVVVVVGVSLHYHHLGHCTWVLTLSLLHNYAATITHELHACTDAACR